MNPDYAKFDTFLFDLDGTLVNPQVYVALYEPILSALRSRLQGAVEEEAKRVGLSRRAGRWDTGDLCRELGCLELYYTLLELRLKQESAVYPEARELIHCLSAHHMRIGVASNSMRRTITAHLRSSDLIEHVHFTFSAEDAGVRKLEEAFWETLVKTQTVNPSTTIMVGDDDLEDIVVPGRLGIFGYKIGHPSDLLHLQGKI